MASTISKKRARSKRSAPRQTSKQAPLDAVQLKQLMKEAVREVLDEAREDELDEQEWTRQFASSQDALEKMAEAVREQIRAGKSEPLDPDGL